MVISNPETHYNTTDNQEELKPVQEHLNELREYIEDLASLEETEKERLHKEYIQDYLRQRSEYLRTGRENQEIADFREVFEARTQKLRDFVDGKIRKYKKMPGTNKPMDPQYFREQYEVAVLAGDNEKLKELIPPELKEDINNYIAGDNADGFWSNVGTVGAAAIGGGAVGGLIGGLTRGKKGALIGATSGAAFNAGATAISKPLQEQTRRSMQEMGEAVSSGWEQEKTDTWNTRNARVMGMGSLYLTSIAFGPDDPKTWLISGGVAVASGLLPMIMVPAMKAVEEGAEITGTGIYHTTAAMKNSFLSLAHWNCDNAGQLLDGKREATRTKEAISASQWEYLKENRPANVSEDLHEKLFDPEKKALNPEEIKEAALFCVRAIDPKLMLNDADLVKLQDLNSREGWSPSTVSLLRRTFTTLEAKVMWDHFMLDADIMKDLDNKRVGTQTEVDLFAEHFAEAWVEKEKQRKMTRDELTDYLLENKGVKDLTAFSEAELKVMFPGINTKLDEVQTYGIRNFMEEGGIQDILVVVAMLYVGTAGVYYGSQAIHKLTEDLDKTPKDKAKEKHEKEYRDAQKRLSHLFDQTKIPGGDKGEKIWNGVLDNLEKMGVVCPEDKTKMSFDNIGFSNIPTVLQKLKEDGWHTKAQPTNLAGIRDMRTAFIDTLAKIPEENGIKKGSLKIGHMLNKELAIEGSDMEMALENLQSLKKFRTDYESFLSTQPPAYREEHGFFNFLAVARNTKNSLFHGGGKFKKWLGNKGKRRGLRTYRELLGVPLGTDAKIPLTKKKIGGMRHSEKYFILNQMGILGVPEMKLRYLESLPWQKGVRMKEIYSCMDEVLAIYT
ncbi:hypothetical protein K9M41_00440 [Candidatus Gracilibacteria bacterium]|nr:hypothetical protein [Candidatus Gracilibacteria bacterium]